MSGTVHPFRHRPVAVAPTLAALNARLAALAGLVLPDSDPGEAPDWQLDALGRAFALDPAEQQAILLAAAAELRGDTRALVARIGDGPPSVGLMLRVCEGLSWKALRPDGALRRARLLKLGNSEARFTERPVSIEEPVLHFLNGVQQLDPALADIALPAGHDRAACADEGALAAMQQVFGLHAETPYRMPLIDLVCDEPRDGIALGVEALRRAEMGAVVVPLARLPRAPREAAALRSIWLRDSLMHNLGLVLVNDVRDEAEAADLVTGWTAPAIVVGAEAHQALVPTIRIAATADRSSQRKAWGDSLGPDGEARHAGIVDRLAFTFRLSAATIGTLAEQHKQAPSPQLWQAARAASHPRSEHLLERFEPRATLDAVILPDDIKAVLETMVAAAKSHHKVVSDWSPGESGMRGLGISTLFSGESGTGKTMAAEAIASELEVDLYRVEVSAVVSKYIGETEKNLRRIFASAEASGAVLLFDEADTMFGKRSEVRDAHDRYANMEVGYLLQLMESYRGLAILTTNLDDALDGSFMRRLRFVAKFPLPGPAERARIWAGVFPESVAVEPLDFTRLARLSVTGGVIQNIALGAAFRAAGARRAVTLDDILASARAEYLKLDRPLGEIDQKSWS
jgi:ATPase family associated with various cellular activities (AAA)